MRLSTIIAAAVTTPETNAIRPASFHTNALNSLASHAESSRPITVNGRASVPAGRYTS